MYYRFWPKIMLFIVFNLEAPCSSADLPALADQTLILGKFPFNDLIQANFPRDCKLDNSPGGFRQEKDVWYRGGNHNVLWELQWILQLHQPVHQGPTHFEKPRFQLLLSRFSLGHCTISRSEEYIHGQQKQDHWKSSLCDYPNFSILYHLDVKASARDTMFSACVVGSHRNLWASVIYVKVS